MASNSPFGSGPAVTFDLEHGQVRLDSPRGATAMVVPLEVMSVLWGAADAATSRAFGTAFGAVLARRISARVGDHAAIRTGSIEGVAAEISAELALWGLGSLSLERWGKALVFRLEQAPMLGAGADEGLAALIAATLSGISGAAVHTLPLMRQDGSLRLLVASAGAVERVQRWLREGVSWGDAITKLHGSRPEAA